MLASKEEGEEVLVVQENAAEDNVMEGPTELPSSTRALQNEMILKEVLSYLGVRDLKKTSLVNRKWCRESRLQMSKQCRPRIALGEMGCSILRRVHPRIPNYGCHLFQRDPEIRTTVKLVELINNRTEDCFFPCTKFLLNLCSMWSPAKLEILGNFLQAVDSFVEEVEISFCANTVQQMGTLPVTEYTKLKKLRLKIEAMCLGNHQSRRRPAANFEVATNNALICFTGILHQSPNLTSVAMNIGYEGKETMDLLISAMDSPQGRKIRSLELSGYITDDQLMRIGDIGLKLQAVTLTVHSLVEPRGSLRKFLETQSDSLEELSLKWSIRSDVNPVVLSRMSTLKRFRLSMDSEFQAFSGVNYQQHFPNLTSFSMDVGEEHCWQPFLNTDMKPLAPLRSLEFSANFGEGLDGIFHAARVFPNVKKLEICPRESLLPSIYSAFENVEELTLQLNLLNVDENSSVNKMLTGFSTEQLMALNRPKKSIPEFLHRLKVLKLTDRTWRVSDENAYILADQACQILLKWRSLQCLDLTGSGFVKISERMLHEMRKKFLVLCNKRNIIRG